MRKLNFFKTLLVAVGLCAGVNAWAEDVTYDLVWEENIAKVCTDWGASANGTVTLTDNGSYKNVSVTYGESTHDFNTNLAIGAGRPQNYMCRFAISSTDYNPGFYYSWNAASTIAVLNAKKDEIITIRTTSNTVLTATNATANAASASEYVHKFNYGGKERSKTFYANEYTVSANGTVSFTIPNYIYVGYVSVKKIHVDGVCENPTYNITSANNNARTFTLSCATDESSIYYSTSELSTATGGTLYSSPVETESTTIWAYAKTDAVTSDVISFSTGAGTTLSLAKPTISATGFTNANGASVNNPIFNFNCDNTAILGKPTAILSYTFTPDGEAESSEITGSSFTPTTYGTLKVIASAEGYASSEKELIVSNLYTISFTGRDYSTATHADAITTWGDAYNVEWDGWAEGLTAYMSSVAVGDDQHLNIQNANTISLVEGWGWVRGDQKPYGYRVRYAKEGDFIAFKENTSKGADATATTYQTEYCTYGTGVITDLVTINVPAAYAVQQLYHYTAMPNVSKEISAAGYATYCSPYALDFTYVTALTAYTASKDGSNVKFTKVTGSVPAGTGLLLKGKTASIPVVASSSTDVSGNKLIGVLADTHVDKGAYVLMNASEGIGFYKTNNDLGFTVGAGTAYLPADVLAGARAFIGFDFDDEVTGISAVKTVKNTEAIYNLNGQRVKNATKGLFIKNGKKFVNK